MKKLNIRFEPDPSLSDIDVVFRAAELDEKVTELMEKLSGHPSEILTVFDKNERVRTLKTEKIILASVNGRIVDLTTDEGVWHTRQTLQNLEGLLNKRKFVRISRYEIINLEKVIKYDFTMAGTLRIELSSGIETWASRRSIPEIRRRLTERGWN